METEISEQNKDRVSLHVEKKLALLLPTHSEHCIFRVHVQLRKENEKAYEPTTVAIGPYHRGKENLKSMEEHKFRYLQQILHFNNESSVDRFVMAMRDLEERARNCYAESFNLDSDELVEMMLLDGFFILHFFRKCMFENLRDIDPHDPIFHHDQTQRSICLDLMLFENQLPLFILDQLVNMTKFNNPEADNIVDLAQNCLLDLLPSDPNASQAFLQISNDNVHHIMGLMHKSWCSSFVGVVSARKQEEKWEFIKSTTELQEAGVKFKKSSQTTISLLDIKFENGVMEIPHIAISDDTECVFRNLIAYEQCFHGISIRYFTDYTMFMDCLVNSAKDVEKLRHEGIIENWLGDDEVVSTMFNKLGNQVLMYSNNFCYSDIFNNVNRHCRQRRHIWSANLRRNYFNTPWSIISFIAAAALLLLTLIQAIYAIISYHLKK